MFHEALDIYSTQPARISGNHSVNLFGSLIPNRISYTFDWTGPSANYDTACSSSIFALEAAVRAIESGKCNDAVIVGANLILTPIKTLMFNKAGMLSNDYTSRSFDSKGLGYVRAEAVVTIYIQKQSMAKRSYLTILGIGNNTDGYKEEGSYYPSAFMQEELLDETYHNSHVDPNDVSYVEAHGTGTPAGDPMEIKAISQFFCQNKKRKNKLLVGSIKSNMGHAESGSGICSIAKIIVMIQSGVIPANLHFEEPHFRMKYIRDDKIKVVTENTKWESGLIGLNSFGFGGVNTHVILKPNIAPKQALDSDLAKQDLVLFSGNTFNGVKKSIEEILSFSDPNLLYLVNEVHKVSSKCEKFRGFGIKEGIEHEEPLIEIGTTDKQPVSLWYVFNGMGSQWFGMGQSLLQNVPIFRKAFDQCRQALKQFDFDLEQVFNSQDPNIFTNNPTNSFVCIGVIQIGLLDILSDLGLRADGFIGHSCGEHLCAYAVKCLTREETIISIFLRGQACKEFISNEIEFGMAAVNMGFEKVQKICPQGLYAVCNNGPESTTIAGPNALIQKFKAQLEDSFGDINVKEVQSSGMPFHSPYLEECAIKYKDFVGNHMNIEPTVRSRKWISTSIPEDQWGTNDSKIFTHEYFCRNFSSPVNFLNALRKIPNNSTVIEVGPSGLLRGLIQRATKDCSVVPLQIRNETNCLLALHKGLGRLYLSGVNIDLNKIINDIKIPVPGNTPMIGNLVDWDHSVSWGVPNYQKMTGTSGIGLVTVDLANAADAYLEGHTFQGRVLYPTTGYIQMIWKLFAQMNSTPVDELPVVFENFKIQRVTLLRQNETLEFHITISEVSGNFEVKEGDAVVCCGKIRLASDNEEKLSDQDFEARETLSLFLKNQLKQDEIYKKLRHLGYEYDGLFKGILSSNLAGTEFKLGWKDNWVGFLDTCLQATLRIYSEHDLLRDLPVPTEITKVLINPIKFHKNLTTTVNTHYNPFTSFIKCQGIEIEGVKTANLSRNIRAEQAPMFSNYAFEPYFYEETGMELGAEEYSPLLRCISIVVDNMSFVHDKMVSRIPNILELCSAATQSEALEINNAIRVHFSVPEIHYTLCVEDLSEVIQQTFTKANIKTRSIQSLATSLDWLSLKWDLVIIDNSMSFDNALKCLRSGGFMILKLQVKDNFIKEIKHKYPEEFQLISHKVSEYDEVFLIRKKTKQKSKQLHFTDVQVEKFGWIDKARDLIINQEKIFLSGKVKELPRLYFISNGVPLSGIIGFINCLRKEPYSSQVRCIFSQKEISINLKNPDADPLLRYILDRDLVFNVIDENGVHGCYIHSQIMELAKTSSATSSFINIGTPGDLTTFKWCQGFDFNQLGNALPEPYVPVQVYVSGLNFKDVMIATGNLYPEHIKKYPTWNQSPFGLEFAGVIASDDNRRVCGFASAQCLSSQVLVEKDFLIDIPQNWSFQDAATIPVVYSTVYYALVLRGNIQQNSSILVHSGAGGVGIATIRIALSYNCQIFTTVSSEAKIKFIKDTFPEIPEFNIGYSRDSKFEHMVRNGTQGRGVSLVVNSLSGDKLEASLRCLAPHGQFLEIGRVDLSRNTPIGSDVFMKDASMHGIYLMAMTGETEESKMIWKQTKQLLLEGIKNGVVQPLPYREFNKQQIEPAFRYMGQGVHIGKVLINIRDNEDENKVVKTPSLPQIYFHPEKVYIIFGGLGGVAQELINWMTLRFARKILITSRSGKDNLSGYSQSYLKIWEERGVKVDICRFKPDDNVETVFQAAMVIGPTIGGVFNLTMHLDPRLLKDSTIESFETTMSPKTKLTIALDEYSRNNCPELDYFVVFSSISAGLGYDGMTSYGFGNSSMERLIEKRRKDGLPGTGIQFGPIGDVGAWHDNYNTDYTRSSFHGSAVQSIGSVLKSLDYLLSTEIPSTAPITLCRRTINLNNRGDGSQVLEASLLDRLGQILGHSDGSKLNVKCTLAELGMESVMSIEAKSVLENEFGLSLSASALRELTLEQINEMAGNKQNERTVVRATVPHPKPATAGLVQLNFFKNMNRSFQHDEIIYPINQLAKAGDLKAGVKVIICNSLEGPEVLRPLGSYLKVPTFCVQFPSSLSSFKTCPDLAQKYYEKIKEIIPEGPYFVAGLSAGIYPAFELALMFEAENKITKFVLMDMTFERFNAIVEENGGLKFNDANHHLMVTLLCQVFGFEMGLVEERIRGETTREGKMKKLIQLVSDATGETFDADELETNFVTNWSPLFQLFEGYEPGRKYNGKVGLIKTTQNLIAYDSSCEDWGLHKICTQKPDILNVDTTHSYMIAEPAVQKLAAWFNKSL